MKRGSFLRDYVLRNGVVVRSDRLTREAIGVQNEKIISPRDKAGVEIDLQRRSYVYPALINTHDHLRGNYLPRVGPSGGRYYLNWLPWDNDLKASPCYAERTRALDIDKGYLLSAYKTLFSGVVTINDHFPHKLNEDILPTLPIRAIQRYSLAHECSSYELQWGDGIEIEHARAKEKGWPFITHLAEGFDEESMNAVPYLERLGILDKHCLFVHCIALSDEDIKKCAAAGVSVSWCAASNMFMFNTTCKIKKMIDAGINVTLGTDSSHTGAYNMLEEIRGARALYRQMYGEELSARLVFRMVTGNAAKALWVDAQTGSLDEGKYADILILKVRRKDPYENLCAAKSTDIELLTCAGKPVLGEMRFINLFEGALPEDYTTLMIGGRKMFVAGDPLALYRHIRKAVGYKKKLDFLPFEPDEQKEQR
jgi:cytosine/adenosine deaminase-related metal-dependent hydrolase